MLKITAILSLILIATWSQADTRRYKREAASSRDYDTGSTWTASLSCDSCGSECASACGTRHFRSCCFNYLRKKRGPESLKFFPHSYREWKPENDHNVFEDVPEAWVMPGDFKFYPFDDTYENRLQAYDS